MKTLNIWIVIFTYIFIIANIGSADNTPDIISFTDGQIIWTNVNPDLYYTVEWIPALTGTNDWTGSFRCLQDLQSSASTMTSSVPMFFRITGNNTAAHTVTLSPTTTIMTAGYYEATNLTQVSEDLVSSNIRAGITLFGIAGDSNVVDTSSGDAATNDILTSRTAWVAGNLVLGTRSPSPLPRTGCIDSYASDDDGALQKGVAWPDPRFTVQPNTNCILDNLTGLTWMRDANILSAANWDEAVSNCGALVYGNVDDWRLPNVRELYSLIDFGNMRPALPTGHPFVGIQEIYYWSSTRSVNNTSTAWMVLPNYGYITSAHKTTTQCVWAVSGEQ